MNVVAKIAIAAFTPVLFASAAFADIAVCNDFRGPVHVALATDDQSGTYAAGWWRVEPNACKDIDFPFQGTTLFYVADSDSYHAGGATRRDHWGDRRSLFVSNRAFNINNAEQRHPGSARTMFSAATVATQLQSQSVAITLRFSPGNTTINMKAKGAH